MKKMLVAVLAVAVAALFALTATAAEKTTVKTKTEKEVVKVEATPTGVNITDVTKHKHGDLWRDKVTFKEYKAGEDYVYVIKEDKTYRVKFRDTAKENLMKCKKGDQVTIVSTYPLAGQELERFIVLHNIEKAEKK